MYTPCKPYKEQRRLHLYKYIGDGQLVELQDLVANGREEGRVPLCLAPDDDIPRF